MNIIKRCGLVLAAITFTINAWATDLNTEEQKLGYIIGMDIGKSLREQGTEVDMDTLIETINAAHDARVEKERQSSGAENSQFSKKRDGTLSKLYGKFRKLYGVEK